MAIVVLLYLITSVVLVMAANSSVVAADQNLLVARNILLVAMAPLSIKFAVQLVGATYYSLRQHREVSRDLLARRPRVSVIVPAWNEEVGILRTMQSVIATQYPNLELIVVNDGSTDRTHEIVMDYLERHNAVANSHDKADIKYLQLSNGGKANAMNQGLLEVTGEFVVTLDADSLMDKNTIVHLLRQFDGDEAVGAVAGNVIVGNRRSSLGLLQQMEYLYGFFFRRADSAFNSVYIIGGAAAAYRKSTLDAVGGFDHAIITEDIELSMRILSRGYKTRYAADAVVFTEGPSDWKGLSKQRLRWKYGRLLTFIKHREMFFNPWLGNAYLSFLLLPVAVLSELMLLLAPLSLSVFIGYTLLAQDYLPMAIMAIVMTGLVFVQVLCDSKAHFHRNVLLWAPIAWLAFYAIDAVEFKALCQSLRKLAKRQSLEWQVWQRVGLVD